MFKVAKPKVAKNKAWTLNTALHKF
jgi:hypothetical protein